MTNRNAHDSAARSIGVSARQKFGHVRPLNRPGAAENVAAVYDQAGEGYAVYADGNQRDLFAFDGLHSYADRCVWALLDAKLTDLRTSGVDEMRILDAGCGPGTWLRRLVTRAHALGFARITARGFDIAQQQIERARLLSRNLSRLPGVTLTFDVADLRERLPEADGSVDLTLCLYSVLSHLPVTNLPAISAEFARVTSGSLIITVRPIGSPPSVFVDSIEKAHHFKLDHRRDLCEVELFDGRHFALGFHLFTASELRSYFTDYFDIQDLRGLDLFHSRFAPDPRWNPLSPAAADRLSDELARIEETYASSPGFMEHAAHLLLVTHRRAHASGQP
jgi:SAM-dependent methyltransferase